MTTKTFIIGKSKKSIAFDRKDELANIHIKKCVIPELDQLEKEQWFSTLRNYSLKITLTDSKGSSTINTIGFETLLQPKHQYPLFSLESNFDFVGSDYISIQFEIIVKESKATELNFEFSYIKTKSLREKETIGTFEIGIYDSHRIL